MRVAGCLPNQTTHGDIVKLEVTFHNFEKHVASGFQRVTCAEGHEPCHWGLAGSRQGRGLCDGAGTTLGGTARLTRPRAGVIIDGKGKAVHFFLLSVPLFRYPWVWSYICSGEGGALMRGVLAAPLFCLLTITAGGKSMADNPTPSPEEVQKQIEAIKKQADLVNAQKGLLEAQKGLTDAQKALSAEALQAADQIAAAKAAKDLADAKKAQADASLAAFKATIGDVPTSGYTGSVDVKTLAGEIEAGLLATKAVREAAMKIDAEVRASIDQSGAIVAMATSDVPTFQNLILYKAQVAIVRSALNDAVNASRKAGRVEGATPEAVPLLAAAGTVLDAANKLLSFVRSDYSVGGVAVTLDDALAVDEVANLLRKKGSYGKAFTVTVPGIYNPQALADSGSSLVTDLKDLTTLKVVAESFTKQHDAEVDRLTKAASVETNPDKKAALQKDASQQKALADGLRAATALFSTWFGKLSAVDDKGSSSLVMIVKEKAIADQLAHAHLLILKVQKAGGGYLVKKNVWTFFGGMPLYHMGGAAVSYLLLDGTSGNVTAAGVVPIHGGFVKAGKLRDTLAQ